MDPITSAAPSRSRFRFRDQSSLQELISTNQVINTPATTTTSTNDHEEDGELLLAEEAGGQTPSDSSSVSNDPEKDDEDSDLESMTAKGIKNLCLELLELKSESDEDFRKSMLSNYSAFLSIFGQMEGLESELMQLKFQATSYKMIVEELRDSVSLTDLSEEIMESVLEDSFFPQASSPTILEAHTEDVLEILDILLSEHRLDEALTVLEMEGRAFQSVNFRESFSLDELRRYNSAISEKRAALADQLTLLAKNPRISAPELQQALVGLCDLGNDQLALKLLLDYYHQHIMAATRQFHSSKAFLNGELSVDRVSKQVFSIISQVARSFVGLHGEASFYPPELIQWTNEQTRVFADLLTKHVESASEISGGLSTALEAVLCALSYCNILENQEIILSSCLINHIRPHIEQILHNQVDHYKKVIEIFTSTDTWILGRYLASGVLCKGSSSPAADKKPEYCLLTNSGRKFLTLFQGFVDESSPLVSLEMEVFLLRELMELFTEYIMLLEEALTTDEDLTEEKEPRIHAADSLIQGVSVIANLFTLLDLFTKLTNSVFGSIDHLKLEIATYELFIQDTHLRLRAHFLQRTTKKLFSPEAGQTQSSESSIVLQDDFDVSHLVPSITVQVIYLELRKLQKFAEDSYIEADWLVGLLRELMEAIFAWMANGEGILIATEDLSVEDNYTSLMQFILDTQFLEEIARNGGFTSDMINATMEIENQVESSLVSAQFSLERYATDRRQAIDAAVLAIQKLEELHEKDSVTHEIAHNLEGESSETEFQHSADSFGDEDSTTFSKQSYESPNNLPSANESEIPSHTQAKMCETESNPFEGDTELEEDTFDALSAVDCFENFRERLIEIERDEHNSDNATSSLLEMLLAENEAEEAPADETSRLQEDSDHETFVQGGLVASASFTLATDEGDIDVHYNCDNVESNMERTTADPREDSKEDMKSQLLLRI